MLFPPEAWDGPDGARRYTEALWIDRADGSKWVPGVDGYDAEMLASWDMTFADTAGSDYVAGQVWLRRGAHCYLLDQVHERMDFVATCAAVRILSARWPQALLKLVENKANGPAVISMLSGTVPGIVPEEPDGSKTARAAAITPLIHAGQVHLPTVELAPWVGGLIEEAKAFRPGAAHDDQVDALSQALKRLVLLPLSGHGGDVLDQEAFLEEEEDLAYLP